MNRPTRPEPESGPLARVRDDVDRELQAHLDERVEALVRTGVSAADARAQALREFGDLEDARQYMGAVAERAADVRRRKDYMGELRHDVRYAVRRLWAAPSFTITSLLTLALGIGATTAIFSLVYGVVFRSLPFPVADRLYTVYSANPTAGNQQASVSAVDVDDWRARRRDVAELGGVMYMAGSSGVDLTGRGDPRQLPAAFITPGFFEALGVVPAAGRLPREDEMTRAGDDDVVLLTHRFWQREFAGSSDVLGTSLTISGRPHRVLGVLPESMRYPAPEIDVFVPYSTIPDRGIPRIRPVRTLDVVARAKPGITQAAVQAEMNGIAAQLAQEFPDNRNWTQTTVVPLGETVTGPVRDGLVVLLVTVLLTLLMAAINVAALQVARASGRGRELAVRVALGARKGRLVRQLLTESFVIAAIGCAAGVALSYGILRVILGLAAGQIPRAAEVGIDGTAMLFAVGVSLVSGLIFGVAPALRAIDADPQIALAGSRGSVGAQSHRLRSGLVVAEVAVAVMLVLGGGLMGRSFLALMDTDPGFDPNGLVAVQLTINTDRHEVPSDPSRPGHRGYMQFYQDVIDRVRALPGVESAAAVKHVPFRGNGERNSFGITGRTRPAGEDAPTAAIIHVSGGYFDTIGARLKGGREFTRDDRAGTPLVVMVNEAFERRHFPGENAVGQRLDFGRPAEIIGVVRDIRQVAMSQPSVPTIYISNLQNGRSQMTVVARTAGDPMALVPSIRQAVWTLDSQQAITDVYTFEDSIALTMARPQLLVVLLGGFAVMGLLLGAVGIYGVLAALVSQRRQEIGVRMVLGARPSDVLRLVIRRGLTLTTAGLAIGLAGAWWLTTYLASVLYDVEPTDPATFAVVILILLSAALLASWIPAARAARVDPASAMRD